VDPEKILSSEAASKKFRAELGVGEDEFLIGTACFLRSWKGIQDFLKAADLLRDVKWVIIGGGHEETYRQMAKDLKLDGIVHFTGHLENPFPALGALDVFALLSTAHEGVSQAILQAAYLKRPLISTQIGGLGEVCLNRVTGIQVEPFSPREIVKAVLELRESPTLRQQMGMNGKKLVEESFTFEKTLREMEKVYQIVARK
jgi:glycosyltransferase involved in cell wall biosynthesis